MYDSFLKTGADRKGVAPLCEGKQLLQISDLPWICIQLPWILSLTKTYMLYNYNGTYFVEKQEK